MRSGRLWLVLAALALAIVAYAWIDGGREQLHEISQPVTVPDGQPAPEGTP